MSKLCNTCGETKGLSEFHKRGTKHQLKCKDCKRKWSAGRYSENRDHRLALNADWRINNPEKMAKLRKDWSDNVRVHSFYQAWHRCNIVEQSHIDREALKGFYRNTPEGYEVDHIIPTSKGGLHVMSNVQYLTVHDNRVKSNKLEV